MIAFGLLRHLGTRQGPFLAACAFLLGLFQFLICAAVASADVGAALETLVRSLPPFLQEIVATQIFGGLSERGLLAFGWNHPISQALGTAAAIVLAVRAVAGEVETGAAELLLSQPLSRAAYLGTNVIFALAALALLTLAGIAGTIAGQAHFGMQAFRPAQLLRLGLDYFLLQSAWYAITLVLSAIGRESGRVATAGFLLALVSYFAQAVGKLWNEAAFVLPWSLYGYFSPADILLRPASLLRPLVTLLAVTLASLSLAAWRFQKRDLP